MLLLVISENDLPATIENFLSDKNYNYDCLFSKLFSDSPMRSIDTCLIDMMYYKIFLHKYDLIHKKEDNNK
ncbi:MAG: hypothetical protein IJ848_03965 [Alphaproteobacteria bacterium]|nr:hypothetical protein [Alphaproteobacteria bacterium]